VYNIAFLGKSDFLNININNKHDYNDDEAVFKLPDFMDVAREMSWESLDNIIEYEKYTVYFCNRNDNIVNVKHNIAIFDWQGNDTYIKDHIFLKKRIHKYVDLGESNCFMSDKDFEYYSNIYNSDDKHDDFEKVKKKVNLSKPVIISIHEKTMLNIVSDIKESVEACVDDIYAHDTIRYLTLYDLCIVKKGDAINDVEILLGDPDFIIETKTCMSYCYYYCYKFENEPMIFRRLVIDFNDDKIVSNINYIF